MSNFVLMSEPKLHQGDTSQVSDDSSSLKDWVLNKSKNINNREGKSNLAIESHYFTLKQNIKEFLSLSSVRVTIAASFVLNSHCIEIVHNRTGVLNFLSQSWQICLKPSNLSTLLWWRLHQVIICYLHQKQISNVKFAISHLQTSKGKKIILHLFMKR